MIRRRAPIGALLSLLLGCSGEADGDRSGEDGGGGGAGSIGTGSGGAGTDVSSRDAGNEVSAGDAIGGGAATKEASADAGDGGKARGDANADQSPPGYNPCSKAAPCVVMPLGDSITYGDGSTNHAGWRAPLFHMVLTDKKTLTFVGGMSDGPDTVDGVAFPKHHEGHSGYEIAQVAGFAADAIKSQHPEVVLLMLGTNDIAFGFDVGNAPMRLGQLIDLIVSTDPNLLLVVAQIVPSTDDPTNAQIRTLNAAIPGLVKTRADAGAHVRMVDMYAALTSSPSYKTDYMFNKFHPNDAGYVQMARTWYAELGPLLR